MGQIVTGATVKPHLRAILAGNHSKPVVLDLMQPLSAGRQSIRLGWKARRDESGWEGTLQHSSLNTVEPRGLQLPYRAEPNTRQASKIRAIWPRPGERKGAQV